jgi:hypothetical protein
VWASASEPSPFIDQREAPIAVAISDNGERIMEQVKATNDGMLLGLADRGFFAPLSQSQMGAMGLTIQPFVPVYSRTLGTVFLVGGTNALGRGTGTIARGLVTGSDWAELVPPVKLRQVLAATYSFRTQSLYVLDQRHESCDAEEDQDACEAQFPDNSEATVRFLRVDALRGGGEEIASWPARDLLETVWLGSDLDGHVLFSFSRGDPFDHAIIRFDVDDTMVTLIEEDASALHFPVLVDANGYVIYHEFRAGDISGGRYPELIGGVPKPVADMDELL